MAKTKNSHYINDLNPLLWEFDFTLLIKGFFFFLKRGFSLAHISSIVTRLKVLCNLDGSRCLSILSARHVPVTHDLSITVVHSFQTTVEASSVRCLRFGQIKNLWRLFWLTFHKKGCIFPELTFLPGAKSHPVFASTCWHSLCRPFG